MRLGSECKAHAASVRLWNAAWPLQRYPKLILRGAVDLVSGYKKGPSRGGPIAQRPGEP